MNYQDLEDNTKIPYFPKFRMTVTEPVDDLKKLDKDDPEYDEKKESALRWTYRTKLESYVKVTRDAEKEGFVDLFLVVCAERQEIAAEDWDKHKDQIRAQVIIMHLKKCALAFKYFVIPTYPGEREHYQKYYSENLKYLGTYPKSEITLHL